MLISIIITAYNVEPYIEKSILSCIEQSYKNLQIVIVNDCSTDNTLDKITSFTDKRIEIVNNEKNAGAGKSRKIGISKARGEYVLLLDGDDWLDQDFIESLVKAAKDNDADIVSGGMTIQYGNGIWDKKCYGSEILVGPEKVTKHWGNKVIFLANKLVRRTLYNTVPYCERRFIEDTPVLVPIMYLANKVVYIPNTGYNYRMRKSSLTHKASPIEYAVYRALCVKDLINFFEVNNPEYLKIIPLANSYESLLKEIKNSNITLEVISKFAEDWIELSLDILKRIL